MSRYFQVGGQVLWNPSNGVAELFSRTADMLSGVEGVPTGIGAVESDEYQIDIDRFTRFVDELARRYLGSGHPILRSMIEGFTATALVLVDRAGGNVPSLSESPAPDGRDASAGTGGLAAGGDAARLAELREEHAAAMPY